MTVYQLFLEYYKMYPVLLTSQIVFSVLSYVIDGIINPRLIGNLFSDMNNLPIVRKDMIYLFVSWFIGQVFKSISLQLYDRVDATLDEFITHRLFSQVLVRMDQKPESINIALIHSMVESLRTHANRFLFNMTMIIPLLLSIFLSSIHLYLLSKPIGLLVFGITVVFIIIIFNTFMKPVEDESVNLNVHIFESLHDSFTNIHTIRSTDKGINHEIDLLKQNTSELTHQKIKYTSSIRTRQAIMYTTYLAISGYILYLLYRYNQYQSIPSQSITTIILSISPLFTTANDLIYYLPELAFDISPFYNLSPIVSDILSYRYQDEMIPPTSYSIVFDHVTFCYKDQEPLFTDFSLTIPKGMIWLNGQSGSGKSTFIKLLLGLETPQSGTVTIDGQQITTSIKKYVTYLHQSAATLFHTTIYKNIMYGQDHPTNHESHLFELIDHYKLYSVFGCKEGDCSFLQRSVGKIGSEVSGGQRQVIHFLRCLLTNQTMYILDEPLVGLDPATSDIIKCMIHDMEKQGKTILVISHEPLSFPNQSILTFTKHQNPSFY